MSSTSKILLNKVTDEVVIQILRTVIPVLEEEGIEYFIVGAFARDIELFAKGYTDPPARKTKDIDLAVMVGSNEAYEALKNRIGSLPDFLPDENEPYRFIFKAAYEVDFLPFGDIQNEKGRVELKAQKSFVLDIPGFQEVEPWAETIETEEGLKLKVSSLPGIVLLKLLAWEDRPEREKDIHDIGYILKSFYLLHAEEIVEKDYDILEFYEDEEKYFEETVSARYIGRKIGQMLKKSPVLLNRVKKLLGEQLAGYKMARLMGHANLEDSQQIIKAMHLGLMDKKEA